MLGSIEVEISLKGGERMSIWGFLSWSAAILLVVLVGSAVVIAIKDKFKE